MSRSSGWREAGQHASEDARRREEVELINGADNTAYHAERFLQENSSNVPSSQKLELEHRIQEMRGALERRDVSTARSVLTSVEQALQRMGEAGAAAGRGWQQPPPSPEVIVDGEFREV